MGKFVRENDEVEFISWMLKRCLSRGPFGRDDPGFTISLGGTTFRGAGF